MEDYIYILIGVIWLAATIYRASQKKKQQAAGQAKPATSLQDEDKGQPRKRSLFEELFDVEETRLPEPELADYEFETPEFSKPTIKPEVKTFQSEYAGRRLGGLESFSGEGASAFGGIKFEDILKQYEKKPPKNGKIDLRKAVIYSAILERPYS